MKITSKVHQTIETMEGYSTKGYIPINCNGISLHHHEMDYSKYHFWCDATKNRKEGFFHSILWVKTISFNSS